MRNVFFINILIHLRSFRSGLAVIVGLFLTVIVCFSARADIVIADAFVRGLPPGQKVTAAFMRLRNTGDKSVSIISVTTDSAKNAEIHSHLQRDGMMRMEKVESLHIPAGKEVLMQPGGYHLMLFDLYKSLVEGDIVKIELRTDTGDSVNMEIPVRSVLNEHKHH